MSDEFDDEMDYDDWVDAGCPISDRETVAKVADLINRARVFDTNGGNFHIVLEDGNTEDHHVAYCVAQTKRKRDGTPYVDPKFPGLEKSYDHLNRDPEQLAVETEMGDLLTTMSVSDRIAAMAVADGWSNALVALVEKEPT